MKLFLLGAATVGVIVLYRRFARNMDWKRFSSRLGSFPKSTEQTT